MAARSHVTYLTACNSQSRDLHNRKTTTTTTTTTDMEEHEEMSCIKWSKARPLTASSIGSFRFLLGSEPGRLCGVDECQNGYDFMGLILECLLKNRYSHYLSYETILGLCPIKCPIIWHEIGHVTRPSLSLWITPSTFTRVDITWTLRDSLVLLSWLRYFDHQSSDLSTDIALRNFKLRHGFVS